MNRRVDGDRVAGLNRVWALTAQGYRIVDVDSDQHFVGIRMERDGRILTLLLTQVDFARAFPGADAWCDASSEADPEAEAQVDLMLD